VPATHPTIADQVEELHAGMADRLPADAREAFAADRSELDAAGLPGGILAAGSPMPDGDLLDAHARPTTLAAARSGRPAVVVFYRGAWCPYCNLALRTYEQQLASSLAERGIALIAISPQRPDGSLSMQETNALGYAVLSDPGSQIARRLGILTAPNDGALAAQRRLGLDITAVNADGTAALPMPTVVIVDAAGAIRWIDVHPNYTTRSEPRAILDALSRTIG
jgi:peroxiredoxin